MLKPKRSTIIFSLLLLLCIFVAVPHFALARGLVPCGGDGESPCTISDIFVLIARVTNYLIMMAGIYAVFKIVGGGFWLIVSSGNEEQITQKKKWVADGVIGFVLVLMAFMFVNTVVNALLVNEVESCKINLSDPLTYLKIKDNKAGCNK